MIISRFVEGKQSAGAVDTAMIAIIRSWGVSASVGGI